MSWTRRTFFAVTALIVLSSVFFYTIDPAYIGRIISQAGNVTRVDIGTPNILYSWSGIYGNLDYAGDENLTLGPETLQYANIRLPPCFASELYAATAPFNWQKLEPALPSDIDSLLGVSPLSSISGTSMFTEARRFVVYGEAMDLPSTRTNSVFGTYDLGLLRSGSTLVFATHPVSGGLGFDGSAVHYQMLLPVQYNGTSTYYFYQDPTDHCNLPPEVTWMGRVDGYVGEPLASAFYATDPDGDTLSASMFPKYDFLNLKFNYDGVQGRYVGTINFTPSFGGSYHTTFTVSDLYHDVSQRVDFSIGYCGNLDSGGDPKCDRWEDCTTCVEDCGPCRDGRESMVVLHDEACVGQQTVLTVYERYKERACSPQTVNGVEVCSPLSGVKIMVYSLKNRTRQVDDDMSTNIEGVIAYRPSAGDEIVVIGDYSEYDGTQEWSLEHTLTTGSQGQASFTPMQEGEYKIVAEKKGYYTGFDYLLSRFCPQPGPEKPVPPTGQVVENVTEPDVEEPSPVSMPWKPASWQLLAFNLAVFLLAALVLAYIHHCHAKK
jgi:hypothetical protein